MSAQHTPGPWRIHTERDDDDLLDAIWRNMSKAQRAYMTTRAVWRQPNVWGAARWMTFPPPATHRVLKLHCLVDQLGQLSERGIALRERFLGDAACPAA